MYSIIFLSRYLPRKGIILKEIDYNSYNFVNGFGWINSHIVSIDTTIIFDDKFSYPTLKYTFNSVNFSVDHLTSMRSPFTV